MPGNQLFADFPNEIARNGETEPAIQTVDECVHPDHVSIDVAERTAAVAGIDRRIGLQVIRDRIPAIINQFAPAFAADHAVSESVIEPERRADGKGKLTHPHRFAVPELHDRQIARIDLDHSDIRLFIACRQFSPEIRGRP